MENPEIVSTGKHCLFCEQEIQLYLNPAQPVCGCDYMDFFEYEAIKQERRELAERDKYNLPHLERCKCKRCIAEREEEESYNPYSQDPPYPWG
jgi:hypothetical protein